MSKDNVMYKKVYGCLIGGLIGDAMGAQTEDLNYTEIEEKFGWVNDFSGAGTDDSAIRQILCDAIIKNKGYITADDFAESFLNSKEKYYELFFIPVKNMFHKIESKLALPVYAGDGNMHSSSSAMAIAPMGIINACNPRQASLETYDVAGLIHAGSSTFCRDGACVIAAAIAEALSPAATVESIRKAAVEYLHKTSSCEMLENYSQTFEILDNSDSFDEFKKKFYETRLRDIVSDSRETVPCAVALFCLADGDVKKTIEYAANLGRDADTIGTMAGAIAGAYKGIEGFPNDWVGKVEENYGVSMQCSKEKMVDVVTSDQRELAQKLIEIMYAKAEKQQESWNQLKSMQ